MGCTELTIMIKTWEISQHHLCESTRGVRRWKAAIRNSALCATPFIHLWRKAIGPKKHFKYGRGPQKHYVYLVPSTLSRAISKPTLFGGAPSPSPGGSGEDSPKLLLAFSIGAAVRLGQQSCVASLDIWKRKYKYKHNFKYKYMLRREKDNMPDLPSVATVCKEDRGQKAGTRYTPG